MKANAKIITIDKEWYIWNGRFLVDHTELYPH